MLRFAYCRGARKRRAT